MADITINLADEQARRLRERAKRAGVDDAELVARAVDDLLATQDPFEFVGMGSSDTLRGRNVDQLLKEHGFGA